MKAFVDTNVIIYSYTSTDPHRLRICTDLVAAYDAVISTQVLSEYVNVMRRKFHTPWPEVRAALQQFELTFLVRQLFPSTIHRAVGLAEQHKFSFYDSLILAAAVESQCSILFTEDLQHNQLIDGIRVVNPFL